MNKKPFYKDKNTQTLMLYDYTIADLWLASLVFANIGYWVENLFRLFSKGILDSRNQVLPFLFCYSIAMWALYFALGTPKKARIFNHRIISDDSIKSQRLSVLCYFLISFFFIFFGEIVVGTMFEKISGIQLWNYSGIPLHMTQYTSVPTTIALSTGVIVLMEYFFTPLMNAIHKLKKKTVLKIDYILGGLIIIDWLYMMISINFFKVSPNYWSIQF
ncbi:MAG: hypothetical protein ACI4S3_02425 [Candidatus Gastranaerophilaceae bacterium]